jgi:hypothetical protein
MFVVGGHFIIIFKSLIIAIRLGYVCCLSLVVSLSLFSSH